MLAQALTHASVPNEEGGDPKRHLEGWRVLATLDGVDGLARDADAFGQLLLRHLIVVEPETADGVVDRWPRHLLRVTIPTSETRCRAPCSMSIPRVAGL